MKIKKFQEGGMAPEMAAQDPAMAGAPAGPEAAGAAPVEGGEDPLMQIGQVAVQALQTQDCEAAMAVCQAMVQLLQQAMGGAEGAPEEMGAPEGEPVFKCGGKMKKRVKKGLKGAKVMGDVHADKNRTDNKFQKGGKC